MRELLTYTGASCLQYTALLDTLAIEYDKPDKTRFHTCRRYISEAKLS